MQGFESPGAAQRFLAIRSAVYNRFKAQRHLTFRKTHLQFCDEALLQWRQQTTAP